MFIKRESEPELRPDQVRSMAHGLYYLAAIDGVSSSEQDHIEQFLKDGKVDLDMEGLAKFPFSLEELTYSLDTVYLRKAFLKAAILLAKADGTISDPEQAALRRISQALGVDQPLEALQQEVEDKSL